MVEYPGGFWRRFLALLIDGILLGLVIGVLEFMIYGQVSLERESNLEILTLLYSILLPVFWSGYTIGKRVLGVRIMRIDGRKVGLGTMLMREFVASFIYIFTFGIGLLISVFMVAFRKDKRSIHDFVAKTYVTTETVKYDLSK